MRPTTIATLLLATLAAPVESQDLVARIDSVFAPWARTDGPGCIAGARHNGATVYLKAHGMANLEYGVPLTTESVSESGSVAKQFTAAALALLEQQGKLSLDDDIRKYLPEVPDFGRTITIRHLLTHTSGLRDQWALLVLAGWPPGTQVHTVDQILDLVKRQRMLNFAPGELYLYSNTGYTLAGLIVTRVTGTRFAEWTREHLFKPLGMHQTQWRDDFRRIVPDRATAYSRGSGGAWMQDMPFTMVHGNGGLLTTIPDMLTWNDALSSGAVPGGAALVRTLETPGRLNDGTEISYALGLGVGDWRGTRAVTHGGATAGYRTFLARYPERNLSVAVYCNAGNANAQQYAVQMAERILGLTGSAAPPSAPVAIGGDELNALAGQYRNPANDQIVTFTVREGRLAVSPGGPAAPLDHLGNHRFWSPQSGTLQFERDGTGWQVLRFQDGTHRFQRHEPVDRATVRLEEYVGRYRSEELGVEYDVAMRDGNLTLRRAWETPLGMVPSYRDGFAVAGRTVRFLRDGRGRVNDLAVFAGRALDVRFTRVDSRSSR